jgi:benzoyl-CoA reductase subunit C
MWTMLFPDRYVRYVDVPQNYDPKVGGVFWRHEMEVIREDLSRLAGHPITDESLRQSISLYNLNRTAIRDLYEARSRKPWFFPISEMYLILRAGNILPVDEHTALLREYLKQAPLEEERFEQDESRVILVGMFCEQPPLGLLATIERAGCLVVDDDLLLGLRWLKGDVSTDGDPMQNLTEAFLTQSVTTASRYQPEGHRGRWLVESVRRNFADGVIFCAPSFCDPALLEQPMLVSALDSESIPHTQFKYSEDTGQFAVIREQAGTFSDSIRLWSEA